MKEVAVTLAQLLLSRVYQEQEIMFFWMSGVWDATMQRRMIGFVGLMALLALAYLGAQASGVTLLRLVF